MLDRAIPSILQQTHPDYEWVIVDDNSSDSTPQILKELEQKHEFIKIRLLDTNIGRAPALNLAVDLADGDFIANQDFDDISYEDRLIKQYKYLKENPGVGLVGTHYRIIDEIQGEEFVRRPPTDSESIKKAFSKYIPFAHTLVMYRKEAWEDIEGYPDLRDIEDLAAWIQMVKKGWELHNIPEILGEHYVYEESSWNRRFSTYERRLQAGRVHAKAVSELDLAVWMYLYPLSGILYPLFPSRLQKFIRERILKLDT